MQRAMQQVEEPNVAIETAARFDVRERHQPTYTSAWDSTQLNRLKRAVPAMNTPHHPNEEGKHRFRTDGCC
jgi:hypothetical protein